MEIPRTLGGFTALQAERLGARPLVDIEGETVTYEQLHERSNRFANALSGLGVEKGDRVAIMMANRAEFLYAWFGVAKVGAVEVPIHSAARGAGIRHILEVSGARVVVVEEQFAEHVADWTRELASVQNVIVLGAGAGFGKPALDFDEAMRSSPAPIDVEVAPYDPSVILFTGGTTGPPKGVLLTHNANFHLAISVRDLMHYTPDDVLFSVFPLFHVNAKYTSVLAAMVCDARLVMRQRFSATTFWETTREHGITAFNYMGALLTMLYKQPARADDRENPVRCAYGAPAPESIFHPFQDRFGVEIADVYGMTEVGVALWNTPAANRPGSCGKPVPWYEVALMGAGDRPVATGEPGEICIRPRFPHIMIERYWGADDYTIHGFRNLWFHTNDRARMDEDGFYWFLDRQTDSIRRRGENISSWEVEQAVSSHPKVQEAAAYGLQSELTEQDVAIAVVLRPGESMSPQDVLDWCQGRMPHFAVPRYVRFIEELPKTHAQRIQKYVLRDAGVTAETWDRDAAGYLVRR